MPGFYPSRRRVELSVMPIPKNLVGQKFSKLTVISLTDRKPGRFWLCNCECGTACIRTTGELTTGRRLQCSDCSRARRVNKLVMDRKSAVSPHPYALRRVFASMKQRCHNPNSKFYEYYGGKGVTIDTAWLSDSSSFYQWAYQTNYKSGLTIDRIDANGNYEPRNCRWVSRQVQSENRNSVRNLTWSGKTQSIAAWARELGVLKGSLWFRVKSGWPIDRIFTQPFRMEAV